MSTHIPSCDDASFARKQRATALPVVVNKKLKRPGLAGLSTRVCRSNLAMRVLKSLTKW